MAKKLVENEDIPCSIWVHPTFFEPSFSAQSSVITILEIKLPVLERAWWHFSATLEFLRELDRTKNKLLFFLASLI